MQITYTSRVTLSQIVEILDIARDNYIDLANKVIDIDIPTKDLCVATLRVEVGVYLKEMFNPQFNMPVSLSLATNPQNEIVGFTLAMQSSTTSDACGILYCAVKEGYRKQGLTRAMFDLIKKKFSSIALSCNIPTVAIYEKLGFRVTGPGGVQVAMIYGPLDEAPEMNTINFENHEAIQASLTKLFETHGIEKTIEINKRIEFNQAEGARKVLDFINSRKNN